jgi:hypothetical protein
LLLRQHQRQQREVVGFRVWHLEAVVLVDTVY